MNQRIISVGKKHDPHISVAIDDFTDRINHIVPSEWLIVPPSGADELTARRVESLSVLAKIKDNDYVVLLDERGKEYDSEALADEYRAWRHPNTRLTFVIGGAYGVSSELSDRADAMWSLSKLVFPHQVVRLLLVEQLYRALMIEQGHPYHHK